MFKVYSAPKQDKFGTGMPSNVQMRSMGAVTAPRKAARYEENDRSQFLNTIMGRFGVDRYNPVRDPAQEGSIIEDWIPRDIPGIHLLNRRIYERDDVGGPMVDVYKDMMWSDFDLLDITDEAMLWPYQDSMDNMDILSLMPAITGETMVIGRSINGLGWDHTKGVFTHVIPHNPDTCRIRPVPVFGFDALVDLQSTQGWREFVSSQDPRVIHMQSTLPASILQSMEEVSGWKPLDPLTTIFVRRQSSPYDSVGTSIYTRMYALWILQKALIDATAVALRRRAAGVLHVKVGNEKWHASDDQMRNIAGLFMQAEEDIGGGIVVTREGVEADRGASAVGDVWKFSDEYPFLSEGKMRSLGISDSFISGDGTYNNADQALNTLLERMSGMREHVTNQVLVRKVFHTIARVHGFIKPETNSPQGRRQAWTMPNQALMKISPHRLIVPRVQYHKALHPKTDETFLTVLQTLRDAGLPVTKQHWASAAGFDLERAIDMLPEDQKQEEQMKKWKAAMSGGEMGAEGAEEGAAQDPGIFGEVRLVPHPLQRVKPGLMRTAGAKALETLPLWDKRGAFLDLTMKDAQAALAAVMPLLMRDTKTPSRAVIGASGIKGNEERGLFRYVLVRLGFLPGYAMDDRRMRRIAKHIAGVATPRIAMKEMETLAEVCHWPNKKAAVPPSAPNPTNASDIGQKPVGFERITGFPVGPSGKNLISGVIPKAQKDY